MTVLTLPREIEAEVAALTESGLYADEGSVLGDALRTLFAARPDLRREVGCRLYAKGRFSLGRAAEWIGVSIEELKDWIPPGHASWATRSVEPRGGGEVGAA